MPVSSENIKFMRVGFQSKQKVVQFMRLFS